MLKRFFPLSIILCCCAASVASGKPIDFAHDVVPVLEQHCVECHGDKEAKGGFSINSRESFLESDAAIPGDADASYFLELVRSDDPDVQMPPPEKPRMGEADVATLVKWVDSDLPWQSGFSFAKDTYEPPLKPRHVTLPPPVDGRTHPIDRIIDNEQQQRSGGMIDAVDDATFVRRAYLDLIGLLPEPHVAQEFVVDSSPSKYARLVDQLLANDLAYTEHWLTFWNDLLRNDYAGTGFITGGRKQISRWLYDSLLENKPYDVMTRELLAPPDARSRGFIDGIKWRGNVSAGQTVEIQFSQSVAQSFLGINMKCASCHDSFIDRWKLADAYGLAAIYSQQPLQLHRCDKPTGETAQAAWLFPELGTIDSNQPRDKRLQQLADLMTDRENGRYARTIVNRLWSQLMGRGIVHPLDAMHTRPWNEDLLDMLANHFVRHEYDLKAILRLIATSHAYRSRCEVQQQSRADSSEYVYDGPRAKRMTAEQFVDAVWQLTHTAPAAFDAPVIRGQASPEPSGKTSQTSPQSARAATEPLDLSANWIWGDSAADGGVPPGGETLVFRRSIELPSVPIRGAAIITADNAFKLYLGGREIVASENWTQPRLVPLQGLLNQGVNHITIVATNGLKRANAAGLFFECRLVFQSGEERSYRSNENWRYTSKPPANAKEGRLGKVTGPFKPVVSLGQSPRYQSAFTPRIRTRFATAVATDMPMVRASLLKSDFLMRTLGRPNRDQIVTSRPSELTMLEAIELSNGQAFADLLSDGAKYWYAKRYESPEALIEAILVRALSRKPSESELRTMRQIVGEPVSLSAIEDLLWSILMMPEFLVVR
tara:strand:- start:205005 stop:207482 length:2478 start_codon:yes stop_codon:yes gene_type:complete